MISVFKSLDIFNPEYLYSDSKNEIFCEIANFFQHFQQCLHLFCESNLLNRMKTVFYDFVSTWFEDQSNFTFLREFDIVLTNAFSSSVSFARSQKSIFESAIAFEAVILLKRSILQSFALETTSKSTKRLSVCRHCEKTFNFKKIFRQHKREQHAKKFVVNSHFLIDAIKSTCESMKISTINSSSFVSFAMQSKQMFEFSTFFDLLLFANLDFFNSARSHQNSEKKRFNQIIIFIQHLQQCQHLCCESKLLEWMKIIFCDFVDIWFENQSNFIFLHDFNIALTKKFSTTSENLISNTKAILQIDSSKRSSLLSFTFAIAFESTKKTTTCRHCDEIFDFKKSFRKHKSEQHSKKNVKNFRLENNAANLVCSIEEKSIVMNSLVSFELQTSIATSKQKFEFAMIFEMIISSKKSHLSSIASEIVSESMKNKSIQWFTTLSRSFSSFQTFESERRETSVQEFSNICSFFSNDIANSTCEVAKRLAIVLSTKNAKLIAEWFTIFRVQTARIRVKLEIERSIFQLSTLEFESKSMKKFSIQQIVCARICRRCKQSFNFNNKFHEHIRQHHARKQVKISDFRISISEYTYKIKKKSTIICSSVSFISFVSSTLFATSTSISKFVSSTCSHFSVATFNITSKQTEIASMLTTREFTSKRVEIATFNCSFTFSISFFRTFVSKSYFTIDDLIHMFREKFKSFDLCQHQKSFVSSQSDDIRSSRQTHQSQIIVYFLSAVNQKTSISQSLKSSNSKSFQQHTFAKTIRSVLFEKSIKLSYKSAIVFCVENRFSQVLDFSKSKSRSFAEVVFFIFILFRLFSIFFLAFAIVSIVSTATMSCINVYEQVISIIDRIIQ